MVMVAAGSAGQALHPAAVRGRDTTTGTTGKPAAGGPGTGGQGITVAHTHLEVALGCVDGGHASPEVGSMGLLHPKNPIHPGVDHLVAEGAEQGLARQRIK